MRNIMAQPHYPREWVRWSYTIHNTSMTSLAPKSILNLRKIVKTVV
jgi:hypothetical protein